MAHAAAFIETLSPMKTACLKLLSPTGTHVALMEVDNVQKQDPHPLQETH